MIFLSENSVEREFAVESKGELAGAFYGVSPERKRKKVEEESSGEENLQNRF